MDLYLLALLLGFIGLAVMALSGFAGHGHGDTGHGHGDVGSHLHAAGGAHLLGHAGDHAGGHAGALHGHADLAHGHAGGAHAGGDAHGMAHGHDVSHGPAGARGQDAAHGQDGQGHGHADHGADRSIGLMLLAWLSPRVLFGVLVGIGAAGLLLRPYVPPLLTALLALTAGVAFEAGVLAPVWGLLFRFASEPARTLVDAWMEEGTATTAFDAAGDGLVRIELNGEVRQILGRLRPEDHQAGIRVHMGDRVRVEEVDPTRNECVVSWLGPEQSAE